MHFLTHINALAPLKNLTDTETKMLMARFCLFLIISTFIKKILFATISNFIN